MNILFVNYGDFTTNSLNHIAGFAQALAEMGHTCAVAIVGDKATLKAIPHPRFIAVTHDEALANPALFPDRRPADVLHAWTPRESVRQFVLAYQRKATARVIVHLEDNEEVIVSSYMDRPFEELRASLDEQLPKPLVGGLPHPTRYRNLLRLADGVTVIVDTLRDFVPAGVPVHVLPPGVDFTQYFPQPADAALRAQLGLAPSEKVIVFTGSNTAANEAEIRDLYRTVAQLNDAGIRTRLIRTGITSEGFRSSLPAGWEKWTLDLGFVEKARLPKLLALADVLVQPGRPGPFNDYRLPSKLPEFLASGRPVILPASNVGRELADGRDALVLPEASPEMMRDACRRIFEDPKLSAKLGEKGSAFAQKHFDLAQNTSALAAFYAETLRRPANPAWKDFSSSPAGDVTLLARQLEERLRSVAVPTASAWPDILAAVGELIRLCRQLEASTSASDTPLKALRAQLEKDRDDWKRTWSLTDEHAKNLAQKLEGTRTHSENVGKQLTAAHAHAQNLSEQLAAGQAHAKNLSDQLAATRHHAESVALALTATKTHAANLEKIFATVRGELDATQAQKRELEASLEKVNSVLRATQDEFNRINAIRQQLEREMAQATYQLAETRARALALGHSSQQEITRLRDLLRNTIQNRDDLVFQRDEKIRTMQESFSWKSTSWLRWLRRKLIDPRRHAKEAARRQASHNFSEMPEAKAVFDPSDFVAKVKNFRFSVDYPNTWSLGVERVHVRGWCFSTDPVQFKYIRARIGDRTLNGVYGLKRMDVLAALRDFRQAEYSGFKIDVYLNETDQEIVLELGDTQGAWHPFFSSPLRVGPQYGQPELSSYGRWVETYDRHTPESLKELAANLPRFKFQPTISIVMPVYNTPEKWLRKAVASVQAQVYPKWELCIADDASPDKHVRPVLEELAKAEPRIKVAFRPKNGHISAASNSALEIATGEFVALLDHDDELAPHALYEVVALLNAHPDTDLIYSDEDKIDEEGRRHEPYFKPDWLPDLFHGQNYTSHLTVYRANVVRAAGNFRVGYEGSQDWDLALRVVERIDPSHIRHIPKVLYHWRAIPGSTALMLSEKNYPLEAARRALTDHFSRLGQKVELETVPGDHWRIKRPLPAQPPLVSLIIPTRNGLHFLQRCVDSILEKTTYPRFEVIIVDNGSDDPDTLAYLKSLHDGKHPGVTLEHTARVLRYDAPFNFSAINNYAARNANGEILGLLNNDLEVISPNWLDEMASQAVRPEIGCVGAMLYYPNDTIQHAGAVVGLGGVAGHAFRDFARGTEGKFNRARLVQNYSAVTAACLVIRKAIYDEVGGLDEKHLTVAFNDIDFCLRVNAAGYRTLWTPFAELYHHESVSRGAEDTPEKHERFRAEAETMIARWPGIIKHDPAYNPNLSLEMTDFSLAAPPRPWSP